MNKILKVILVVGVSMLSGCISSRSYVDTQYRKASYESIQRLPAPVPVKLNAQFQRNGKPLPAVDGELRGHVERTLRASGVFTPTTDPNVPVILGVTANNIADLAAASAKGFGTGLTFGAAGSMVDDNYEFKFSFRNAASQQTEAVYRHAIHTTIGNAEGPPGMTPTTSADAFGRVVEDVVLNFIKNLQDKGLLSR
jgi:hypothetical protein